MFKKLQLPTQAHWQALKTHDILNGLYTQNRMAVAPNGSISYINDTSAYLQPIVNRIQDRQTKLIGTLYYPAPGLSNDTMPYYQSAYTLHMRKVLHVYAAAQQTVHQGMANTLFMRSTLPAGLYPTLDGRTHKNTTRDLLILRLYAHYKGLKSLY